MPFTLTLADGRKLTAPHNELLSLSPSGNFAVLTHEDDAGFTVIDLLMVISADFKPQVGPSQANEEDGVNRD